MKQPMEQAEKIARANIKSIRTVSEWAQWMGYENPKYFARVFKKIYSVSPKTRLVQIRIEAFHLLIKGYPDISSYEIGQELGLGDEHDLNKYIKRHTKSPPTKWKNG
ncbi:MAG: helix-turn-helix domain-containing protein [Balneolaceae bacterium]